MTDVASRALRSAEAVRSRPAGEVVSLVPSAGVRRASGAAIQHVTLIVDPARTRLFHHELATRLQRDAGIRVTLVRGAATRPVPPSVDLLLRLERMTHRLPEWQLGERLDISGLSLGPPATDDIADLTIDFCGGSAASGGRTVRVLYDGFADEAILFGALLAGRMPTIEIEDVATGQILSRGVPATDNAGTFAGAYDAALAGVLSIALAATRDWSMLSAVRRMPPRPARLRDVVAFEAKTLAHTAVRALYRLCCHTPHWRTCWRFVDGPNLWDSRSLAGTSWNVIPDPGFRFYADPFPFTHLGQTFVFVEDLDHRTNKGVISVVPFDERGPTGPARVVLEEPWHLSYPMVFEQGGDVWMIPESSQASCIALYRAASFPDVWVREATLVSNIEASDATIFRHGGRFWMLAATRAGVGSWSDTLSAFSAPDLLGPWTPHPANPLLVDQSAARPAGAVIRRGNSLWRPVQDCSAGYGTGIGLVEILRLDDDGYEQKLHTVLRADPRWPGARFHTLNRVGRLECIDGSAHSPRSRLLARRLEGWSGRREMPREWLTI